MPLKPETYNAIKAIAAANNNGVANIAALGDYSDAQNADNETPFITALIADIVAASDADFNLLVNDILDPEQIPANLQGLYEVLTTDASRDGLPDLLGNLSGENIKALRDAFETKSPGSFNKILAIPNCKKAIALNLLVKGDELQLLLEDPEVKAFVVDHFRGIDADNIESFIGRSDILGARGAIILDDKDLIIELLKSKEVSSDLKIEIISNRISADPTNASDILSNNLQFFLELASAEVIETSADAAEGVDLDAGAAAGAVVGAGVVAGAGAVVGAGAASGGSAGSSFDDMISKLLQLKIFTGLDLKINLEPNELVISAMLSKLLDISSRNGINISDILHRELRIELFKSKKVSPKFKLEIINSRILDKPEIRDAILSDTLKLFLEYACDESNQSTVENAGAASGDEEENSFDEVILGLLKIAGPDFNLTITPSGFPSKEESVKTFQMLNKLLEIAQRDPANISNISKDSALHNLLDTSLVYNVHENAPHLITQKSHISLFGIKTTTDEVLRVNEDLATHFSELLTFSGQSYEERDLIAAIGLIKNKLSQFRGNSSLSKYYQTVIINHAETLFKNPYFSKNILENAGNKTTDIGKALDSLNKELQGGVFAKSKLAKFVGIPGYLALTFLSSVEKIERTGDSEILPAITLLRGSISDIGVKDEDIKLITRNLMSLVSAITDAIEKDKAIAAMMGLLQESRVRVLDMSGDIEVSNGAGSGVGQVTMQDDTDYEGAAERKGTVDDAGGIILGPAHAAPAAPTIGALDAAITAAEFIKHLFEDSNSIRTESLKACLTSAVLMQDLLDFKVKNEVGFNAIVDKIFENEVTTKAIIAAIINTGNKDVADKFIILLQARSQRLEGDQVKHL